MPAQFVAGNKPAYVKLGERPVLGVYAANSGKTPAKDMQTRTNVKAMRATEKFFADYQPAKTKVTKSVTVLQPGMRMALTSLPTGVPLTAEHIAGFSSGEWILYFYGDIRYKDVFNGSHSTEFCLELSRDLATLSTCNSYNDEN